MFVTGLNYYGSKVWILLLDYSGWWSELFIRSLTIWGIVRWTESNKQTDSFTENPVKKLC